MITRGDIVAVARSYVGTPFHHQGRVKGVGVDCVGVIVCVLRELGVPHEDVTVYARCGESALMLGQFDKYLERTETLNPGDVLAMWVRESTQLVHCAWLTERGTIIHTSGSTMRVAEHTLDSRWLERVGRVYSVPGVLPSLTLTHAAALGSVPTPPAPASPANRRGCASCGGEQ
jgi:cell wall-associated NlpC family hydrolase